MPCSRGGIHAWENCVASCTKCNHGKADRLIEEIGWSLRCPPAVPRGAHWRLIGAAHDGDPQWAAYLAKTTAAWPAPPPDRGRLITALADWAAETSCRGRGGSCGECLRGAARRRMTGAVRAFGGRIPDWRAIRPGVDAWRHGIWCSDR